MKNSEMNSLMEKAEQEIQANIDSVSDLTIIAITVDTKAWHEYIDLQQFVESLRSKFSGAISCIIATASDHFSVTLVKPKDFTFEQLVAYLEQKEKRCDNGEKDQKTDN